MRVAFATGAMSFYAGYDYAHGGISPQECVTPVIDVAPMGVSRAVSITKADWTGLRLKIDVAGGADLRVDLREGMETSGASVLKHVRVLGEHGDVSILVSDDHLGNVVTLVVLDDADRVLAMRTLTIGG